MHTRTPIIAAAALASLAIPTSVHAEGAAPFVFTAVTDGEDTFPFVGCSGEVEGIVTIDFRNTFHVTEFADGRVSVTGNNRGTFDYQPFDGVPSSGRYKSGFHETLAENVYVSHDVFTGAGRDDDGVTDNFNVRNHITWANGEIRVQFSAGCD